MPKSSFADALKTSKSSTSTAPPPPKQREEAPPADPPTAPPAPRRATASKGSRQNTCLIGGHFDPAVRRQLRMIAAEEDRTIQQLLEQSLDMLFQSRGKSPIAARSDAA